MRFLCRYPRCRFFFWQRRQRDVSFFFKIVDLLLEGQLHGLLNEFLACRQDGGFDLVDDLTVRRIACDFLKVTKKGLCLFEEEGFALGLGMEIGRNVVSFLGTFHGGLLKGGEIKKPRS